MTDLPAQTTHISLDDLLELGSDARVEVVNGEVVEMAAAGILHQIVVGNFFRILKLYVTEHEDGAMFTGGLTYLMNSDPRSLKDSLVPDVSFIRAEHIPVDFDITRPHTGVPDLAIEVVSPNDKASEVLEKIGIYLDKGTEQVWVAYPGSQSLHQYRRGSATVQLYQKPEEAIDASAFFPGIEGLTVAAILRLPAWAHGAYTTL